MEELKKKLKTIVNSKAEMKANTLDRHLSVISTLYFLSISGVTVFNKVLLVRLGSNAVLRMS